MCCGLRRFCGLSISIAIAKRERDRKREKRKLVNENEMNGELDGGGIYRWERRESVYSSLCSNRGYTRFGVSKFVFTTRLDSFKNSCFRNLIVES